MWAVPYIPCRRIWISSLTQAHRSLTENSNNAQWQERCKWDRGQAALFERPALSRDYHPSSVAVYGRIRVLKKRYFEEKMRFQLRKIAIQWSVAGALLLSPLQIAAVFAPQASAKPSSQPSASQVSAPPAANSDSSQEDLNSLSIADSKLKADKPVLGEKDEAPRFTRELLQVQWRRGDAIDLYVIKPKGVEKPAAILYLYSYPTETDRFKDDAYCERVTSGGFAAIGFVSALTGHRYHSRPMKEWFVSQLQESLVTSVHDVQMVLNYLAARGDVDMNRIGMFGAGSGGSIAILAAATDSRIKAIDLLDPWADWPDWMAGSSLIPENERPSYLKPEFLKKIALFDPVQWLPKLTSERMRIMNVMDDNVTPKICRQRLESAAGPSVQVVHYDDTRALFGASTGGRIFQWIKQQLPASTPKANGEKL